MALSAAIKCKSICLECKQWGNSTAIDSKLQETEIVSAWKYCGVSEHCFSCHPYNFFNQHHVSNFYDLYVCTFGAKENIQCIGTYLAYVIFAWD